MPTIPALTSISGEISAAPHNNNYSAIRTYVNTYCAFLDQDNTFTGTTQTFPAIVATSGTFSGTVAVTGGAKATATDGTATVQVWCSSGQARIETAGAHAMSLGTNGSARWVVTSGGMLLAQTDNTYDIGAAGAQRPRNVYIAGTLNVGGVTTLGAVTSGAITATGNSTITGTLGGVTTLTCTTVTATNLGGTLTTAAQANVTSLGTLTGLQVTGTSELAGVTTLRIAAGNLIAQAMTGGSFWVGPQSALLTTATAGFLVLPGMNGTPTGVPTGVSGTNGFPMVIDYNASKIWVCFNGTWRATAALT